MIYVSCNPATLARDLEFILANSDYKIEKLKVKRYVSSYSSHRNCCIT